MIGIVVTARRRAGNEPDPLCRRWIVLSGTEKRLPSCHSKLAGFSPSFHTSHVPRPLRTKKYSSKRCFSGALDLPGSSSMRYALSVSSAPARRM